MKSKKLFLILCLIALQMAVIAQSKTKMPNNPKINLEIVGLGEGNALPDGIQVTLFKQDSQLAWVNQGSILYVKRSFSMLLNEKSNYIIKISKNGFASRTYCFSTSFSNKEIISDIKFSFDLNFFNYNTEAEGRSRNSDLAFSMTSNGVNSNNIGVNKF